MDGAVAQKKGIDIKSILGGLVALMILIFGIAMAATIFGFLGYGEPTPVFAGDRDDIVCAAWEDAPAGYQEKFTSAANFYKIQPALLAAIFLQEHGGRWESAPFASSDVGASGPFQFMPETWEGVSANIKDCNGNNDPSIQDISDSACGAAKLISDKLKNQVHAETTKTINQQDIEDVAVAYTGSPKYFQTWRDSGRSDDKLNPLYLQYHHNVWQYFQDLYIGCQNVTGGDVGKTGNAIVDTAMNEVKLWRGSYDDRANDKSSDSYGRYSPENNCPVIYFDGTVLPTKYSCGLRWCGIFVSWVYTKSGHPLNESRVEDMETFFNTAPHSIKRKTEGITPNDIQPGDVIRILKYDSHVGIVVGMAADGKVQTIEGNVGKDTVRAYTENSPSGNKPYVNISDIGWVGKW